jgi:hypothetical protein
MVNKWAISLLAGFLTIPSVALASGPGDRGGQSYHRFEFKQAHFSGHHLRLRRGRHFEPKHRYIHPRLGWRCGPYRSRPFYGYYPRLRHWHYRHGHSWSGQHGYRGHSYFFRYGR